MTCHYRNNNSNDLLACMGLTPLYTDADVTTFASGVGSGSGYVFNYCLSCLRVNRLIRPDIPEGPCEHLGIAPTGPQKAFSVIGGFAARDAEPISHAILSSVAQIGSFFSGIFSGAPTIKELQTQCSVTYAYNGFATAQEQAIANGSLALQDALVNLNSIAQQLQASLNGVMGGHDSAPWSLSRALQALVSFNTQIIYPSLVSTGSLPISGELELVAGGLLAAKLFGAF